VSPVFLQLCPLVLLAVQPHEPAPAAGEQIFNTTSISVGARGSLRLGDAAQALGPRFGFAFGLSLERVYATLENGLQLAAAVDLTHQRHAKDVEGSRQTLLGEEETFDGQRIIADNVFVALQTISLPLGRWRPFLGAGAGLAVGDFVSDEKRLRPGTARDIQIAVRASAGLQLDFPENVYGSVRADLTLMPGRDDYTTDAGERLQVFGPTLMLGLAVGSRFD